MNNVYNARDIYTISGDSCYDNKVMMSADQSPQNEEIINVSSAESRRRQEQEKTENLKKCRKKWRATFQKRSIIDLVITALAGALICCMEFGVIPDGNLGFTCQDPSISYPFKGDTITMTILLITSIFGPIPILILIELFRGKSFKSIRLETIWFFYKELLIGVTLVLFITEVMKLVVGEPRPHFLDSCEPNDMKTCLPGSFIRNYTCTNTRISYYFKVDSARSFPSGHTSTSVFIAIFCSYLVQVRVPSKNVTRLTKPVLIGLWLTWAATCSLTRIIDRRHHWWDVLAGAVLGMAGAAFSISILHSKEKSLNQKLRRASTNLTILTDGRGKDVATNIV